MLRISSCFLKKSRGLPFTPKKIKRKISTLHHIRQPNVGSNMTNPDQEAEIIKLRELVLNAYLGGASAPAASLYDRLDRTERFLAVANLDFQRTCTTSLLTLDVMDRDLKGLIAMAHWNNLNEEAIAAEARRMMASWGTHFDGAAKAKPYK